MNNSVRNLVLTAVAKTVKGTSFVGIRGYQNSQGEVSNYTLLVGINFENVLIHDFNSISEKHNEIFETLSKDTDNKGNLYTNEIIVKAYENVYNSLEKRLSDEQTKETLRQQGDRTIIASDAQADAYEHVATGVKRNLTTNELHVFGLVVKKTVLEPIEYKKVNSRDLTIVQNKIKKLCNFKQDKYRTFKFDEATIKLQGIEL